MKTRIIIICLLWPLLIASRHPMYISVSELDYNAEAHTLEMAVRIFLDDLEAALEAQGTGKLYLGTASESEDADRYIANYLNKMIKLSVDGQEVEGQFLGKEIEQDVVWSYIEIQNVEKPHKISMLNQLLLDLYDSQQNIVHMRVGKQTKSFRLFKGNMNGLAEFD